MGWILILAVATLLVFAHSLYVKLCRTRRELEEEKSRREEYGMSSQNLKQQLTQNVAHELKTPVSSIKGYLETLIQNPEMDEETKRHFLDKAYSQSTRLSDLLRDISTLHRLDEASETFSLQPVAIRKMVDEMVSDVKLDLSTKRMTVLVEIPVDTVVMGDPLLLYSVFRNLLDNAIAYAGEGRHIMICQTEEEKKRYVFSFADDGLGVEESHLPRLFERFYRVDKGRSRKLGGTGLGLAIVKNAVRFHNGYIEVHNRAGGGLEFVFTLAKNKKN